MSNELRLNEILSPEERREIIAKSDLRAWWMTFVNLAMIAGAFAMAVIWPNPFTIILGILILGGRQLGLGVINHECAHHAFFTSKWMNDFVGHWVSGGPINSSVYSYRAYHLKHHKYAGTADDPDLILVKGYPASPASMRRKLTRDLTGRTGIRDTIQMVRNMSWPKSAPFIVSHVVLFGALAAVGAWWAYAMWWAARWFVYPFIVRVRLMGEHGVAINRLSDDPRENTSTTLINPLERIFVGPNYVNYHLEHHFIASVPCYNLRKFHNLLKERGFYEGYACTTNGYLNVIRGCIKKDDATAQGTPQAA